MNYNEFDLKKRKRILKKDKKIWIYVIILSFIELLIGYYLLPILYLELIKWIL